MSKHSYNKAISEAATQWVARHDSGLSGPGKAEFEQWLAADARHKAAFDYYTRVWSALDRPSLAGKQGAILREVQACTRRTRVRRMHLAAAATCACALLAFVILRQGTSGGGALTAELPASDAPVASVVVASPKQRVLEDGSTVELRQDTIIDTRYDEAARRVVLVSGEAHFQVMKDSSRPFVVMAGGMEVRAVGTAFVVKLDAKQVDILVTEGRVAVEKPASSPAWAEENATVPGAGSPERTSALAAGAPVPLAMLGVRERVVVETAPRAAAPVVTLVTPAEINEHLAWRIPRLEFSATPLAEVVALINRYSQLPDGSVNARLVLDESLSQLALEPVSGFFRIDNVATFVETLGPGLGIEGERRGDEIILRKKKS